MNHIVLIGRLVSDPVLKTLESGTPVTEFRLAVKRTFKNKEGEYDADFFRCSIFGKQAELVNAFVCKGSQIGVDGEMQLDDVQQEDGHWEHYSKVFVRRVQFLETKEQFEERKTRNCSGDSMEHTDFAPVFGATKNPIEISESDLPF